MNRPIVKVVIPQKTADLLRLAILIHRKHVTDGTESPLNCLNDYSLGVEIGSLPFAGLPFLNEEFRDDETGGETRIHKNQLAGIMALVIASCDLLLGIYSHAPRELTEWGFVVKTYTSHAPKEEQSFIGIGKSLPRQEKWSQDTTR